MNAHQRVSLLGSGLCLGLVAIAGIGPSTPVSAGANERIVISDSFNDTAFAGSVDPSLWEDHSNGHLAQSVGGNSYLTCRKDTSGGDYIVLGTAARLSPITSVQFDLFIPEGVTRWVGFNWINGVLSDSTLASYNYTQPVIMRKDSIGAIVGTLAAAPGYQVSFDSLLGISDISGKWISVKVVPTSSNVAKYYLAKTGEAFSDTRYFSSTLPSGGNRSYSDAYFGFQTEESTGGFSLDNIHIVGGGSDINEDFSDDVLDPGLRFYQATGVKNGFSRHSDSALDFTSSLSGEYLQSKALVNADTSVVSSINVIDASFTVKFPATATAGETLGFAFGLAEKDALYLQSSVLLSITKTTLSLDEYSAGIKTNRGTGSLSSTQAADGSSLEIQVSKAGSVKVFENSTLALSSASSVSKYAGPLALLSVSNISCVPSLGNLLVKNDTYFVPVTKSVTHNFSNNFFGNPGHEDFYVAKGDGGLEAKDGKLVLTGASDNTHFGSAYQYDAFILDYKLSDIYIGTDSMDARSRTVPEKWIGLDLSRSSMAIPEYGDYGMLYFQITPLAGVSEEVCNLYTNSNSSLDRNKITVTEHAKIPTSLFSAIQYDGTNVTEQAIKAEDQVCVRWVSTGTSISLYLKKASEGEFTLYYTYGNLNLNGYFALSCTGFTYIKYDDFSMANTSSIYEVADNEAPETVVTSTTIYIYDGSDTDVNLAKELQLNSSWQGVLWISLGAAVVGAGLATGTIFLVKHLKKKKEEHHA